MEPLVSWIESTTNLINIGLAFVILLLGVRILKTMRFSLQRGSVRLFILAALFFAAKEVSASIERGLSMWWIHDVHEVMETGFIACLCGAMYLIVQSEKMEISNLQQKLDKDALTGLMNLAAFTEIGSLRLKHAKDIGLPLTLLMLDVDFFKQYNDCFGHEEGNVALKAVASTLQHAVRENDLLARYGGEEFVLLLFASPDASQGAAERIRRTIEAECSPTANPDLHRQLTASIGVSRARASTNSLKELIEVADKQLYCAKVNGRNQVAMAAWDDELSA